MKNRISGVRAWGVNLLIVLGSSLAGATLSEVGLRLIGFSNSTFEYPDSIRGDALRPKAAGWNTSEGLTYIKINAYGYRDRERTKTKPEGVYRIAVLGDSFVEARQVAFEDSFCAILEHLLNANSAFGSKTVEVLNFGVSGYGTTQELLTLRHHAYDFSPDYVLLAFFTGNDIADSMRVLSNNVFERPYFTLQENELVLDTSFMQSKVFKERQSVVGRMYYATQDYSRLVQLAHRAWRRLQNSSIQASTSESDLKNDVYQEPSERHWQEAWRIVERIIREMSTELKQRGIAFGVVTLSNPIQVNPNVSARRQLMEELQVSHLFYPDRRIQALGAETGFPVLNLAPEFQAHADAHRVFLHGFKRTRLGVGHWNEQGHRLAATMIAQWLSDPAHRGYR